MVETLTTERLILRAFQERDAEDVFAYAQNPKIGPSAGWKPHESLEESRQIIRSFIAGNEVWAIVLKETGRVVGSIGLHSDRRRDNAAARMLGYVLSEEYWGQGLTVEASLALLRHAFLSLPLDIVSIVHYPFNHQSRRVIEKCGFRYEGTLRRATQIYTGAVYDNVCYSMTRGEYLVKNGK